MDTPAKPASRHSRKSRRKVLIKILSNSSITGLSRAASETSVVLKVFWALLFTAGLVGFSVNFNSISKRHRQQPILTQINHEYTEFTWPHITFCNPSNPIAFWRKPGLKRKWTAVVRNATALQQLLARKRRRRGKAVTREELALASVTPSEFFDTGVRGMMHLLQVQFHASKKIAETSENYDAFETIKTFEMAFDDHLASSNFPLPCYTLKPELLFGNETASRLPLLRSIKVLLLLDFDSYRFFNRGYQNRKLYMYIGKPDHALTTASLYFITPGTTSHFQITECHLKRLKNCSDHDFTIQLYASQLSKSRRYHSGFNDCRFQLSQRLYEQRCGCYNPYLPIYKLGASLPRLCLNMSLFNASRIASNIECLGNVTEEYSVGTKFNDLLEARCGLYFKPLCNQMTYHIVRRTNIWTTKINQERREKLIKYAGVLPNAQNLKDQNITEEFIFDNCALVDIHRGGDKSALTFEEWEYPLSEFLSDVGGLLGLWLGLSVIGVFELVELIIMFAISVIKGRG